MSVKFFIVLHFQEFLQDAELKEEDVKIFEVLLVIKDWTSLKFHINLSMN